MNTSKILNTKYLLSEHLNVKEINNANSIIISTLIIVLGFAILYASDLVEDKTSGPYLAILSAPFLLLGIALYLLTNKRKQLVYEPTNSPIVSGYLCFDKAELDVMRSMLKANTNGNIEWPEFKKTGNARIQYMVSRDAHFAAVQLFEYVPYHFEIASDILHYSDVKAHPIAEQILLNMDKK